MRPKFLDQPFFHQRAPRSAQSRADYASPVVIHTRRSILDRVPTLVLAIITVAACAATGLILAWRG